jgi:sugar O-acyltransferase (sialic acid O-acetyltransferase NeuD family)
VDDIFIIGAGGHAKVVIDALLLSDSYRVMGILGIAEEVGREVLGIPIIGTNAELEATRAEGYVAAAIAIGSVGDASARITAARAAKDAGLRLPSIVHPAAVVSPHATLDEGVFVAAGAVVGPGARIGACAIVNSGAVVDHDCDVGDFAHISPGAALSGGVKVGARTHVGTGSSVIQYVTIGSDVLVGAGAVVVSDIAHGVVAFGNPARIIRVRARCAE